jgi:hypothetical protein
MIGASASGQEEGGSAKKGEQSGEIPLKSHRKFEEFWEDQVR